MGSLLSSRSIARIPRMPLLRCHPRLPHASPEQEIPPDTGYYYPCGTLHHMQLRRNWKTRKYGRVEFFSLHPLLYWVFAFTLPDGNHCVAIVRGQRSYIACVYVECVRCVRGCVAKIKSQGGEGGGRDREKNCLLSARVTLPRTALTYCTLKSTCNRGDIWLSLTTFSSWPGWLVRLDLRLFLLYLRLSLTGPIIDGDGR